MSDAEKIKALEERIAKLEQIARDHFDAIAYFTRILDGRTAAKPKAIQ
jgi:hypothetical protein